MKKIILTIVIAIFSFIANAQNDNVGIGTTTPDASAKLDVVSTSKGFLPPRMTTVQRDAISNPATGLTLYNITDTCLQVNIGTPSAPDWQCISVAGAGGVIGALDSDGDGVSDDTDSAPNDPCVPVQAAGYTGYDMTNAIWYHSDCDGDGDENGTEVANGSDPYDPAYTMTSDQDGDGVLDIDDPAQNDPCVPEQSAGYTGYDATNTTWQADDCDADGETNGLEATNGSDPYNPAETSLDTDGDGLPDWADSAPTDPCSPTQSPGYTGYHNDNLVWYYADCDSDGANNGTEDAAGSDPYDPNFTPTSDQDGDSIIDLNDPAMTDPCNPTQSAGYTSYDSTNTTWRNADCDSDGETNGQEADCGSDPYNNQETCTESLTTESGAIWMTFNLGADEAGLTSASYGNYYQWGRAADGHEIPTSAVTTTVATTTNNDPSSAWYGKLINNSVWHGNTLSTTGDEWAGINAPNNPCPPGYRIPWQSEFDALTSADITNLQFAKAGYRSVSGSFSETSTNAEYLTATINSTTRQYIWRDSGAWADYDLSRARPIRCIKD